MDVIEQLNQEFAAVLFNGKFRIYNGKNFLSVDDFKNFIADRTVMAGDKKIPVSGVWLKSPDRRTYVDVVFEPGETSPDILNLYQGLSVKPTPGRWSLFEEHIFENICGGRKDHYEWLIQWMAQIVQYPAQKLGTAIVIRGKKGTGKGIFAETFGKLFGKYFIELSSSQHVTNLFNSVYEHSLLICADEAIWAGDKKGEGTLKNLITAPKLYIVYKGYEGTFKKNFTRFIFTTNADWAVPATEDERRFFVLDIGTGWQKNLKMFSAMLAQMSQGGYGAMMSDLMNIKIKANLRIPPRTSGLDEQIIRSEPLFIQFWREKVMAADPEVWPEKIKKETLYNEMVEYCNKRKGRHIVGDAQFFKELRQYIEPWKEIRTTDPVNPAGGRKLFLALPTHKQCVRLLK